MPKGVYLGAYASTQTGEEYILAWEVYWLLPWPISRAPSTTIRTLQTHMLKQTKGFWDSVRGKWEAEGGSIESRVTVMNLEVSSPRLSDRAIAIRHRSKRGRRKPRMTFQPVDMSYFGRAFHIDPPRPLAYRNWRGVWPLGFTFSIDHDPFAQMRNVFQGRSVRMRINAAFRLGAKVRYRTSPSGRGRHILLRVKKRPGPADKFSLRRNLSDDSARIFLDKERWFQLQGEPARKLRPSGVLWDRRRSFNLRTLALGVERRAGRWFAWRTRGALKRAKR